MSTNIRATNVLVTLTWVRHSVTLGRGAKNICEESLNQHTTKISNLSIVLKTVYSTIREALVYNSIHSQIRLNANQPPFQLQFFHTSLTQHMQTNNCFIYIVISDGTFFNFHLRICVVKETCCGFVF